MKKILLLPLFAFLLTACSVDNEEMYTSQESIVMNVSDTVESERPLYPSCFTNTTGNVIIDVSNGFGNPIVVFSANVNGQFGTAKKAFTVRLEVQELSDCEDFYSDSGDVINYTLPVLVRNPAVTPPTISLNPNQLPYGCYKWRIVLESGIIGSEFNAFCQSASPWYEAPLF